VGKSYGDNQTTFEQVVAVMVFVPVVVEMGYMLLHDDFGVEAGNERCAVLKN